MYVQSFARRCCSAAFEGEKREYSKGVVVVAGKDG